MTLLRFCGNSDFDKIHRTRNFGIIIKSVDINLLYDVLVRCDLCLKLNSLRGLCHSCGTTKTDNRINTVVSPLPGGSLL